MASVDLNGPASQGEPWRFGPEPVYAHAPQSEQALLGTTIPSPSHEALSPQDWHKRRKEILLEWGRNRESLMHRPPLWCMDQLCSGSGFFPPRHLANEWFSQEELDMIKTLERLLEPTGHAAELARDMMALRVFDVDVRIIADDSYSMAGGCPLLKTDAGYNPTLVAKPCRSAWTEEQINQVFGKREFRPDNIRTFTDSPFTPSSPPWIMLEDALRKWEEIFKIMDIRRKMYLLNGLIHPESSVDTALAKGPCGGTPMGDTFARLLCDYEKTARREGRPLLLLALTDGEANDKALFNSILDEIQDGVHGDVQVCLMGLSFRPEDIEWFEDEECDDTRIRTIEPFEVEQQLILYRKVVQRSADYNFAMHTYRALVTNFFPADYDYEAPIQTLRHRLYITLHALDRRFTGNRDADYSRQSDCFGTLVGGGLGAFLALKIAGAPCGACVAGIALWIAASSRVQGKVNGPGFSTVAEEGLTPEDDRLLGALVLRLQQQANDDRCPSVVTSTEVAYRPYNRNYRGMLPYINPAILQSVQRAIGALSPTEARTRDLQYQDVDNNNKALGVALNHLRTAATQY